MFIPTMPSVPAALYLILSGILFTIGVIGALTRRNAIIVFMSIELMLNAVNLTFITFSRFLQSMDGVLFAFFVMAVAAAEAAVGLAIFVLIYRSRETINVDEINLLEMVIVLRRVECGMRNSEIQNSGIWNVE